MFSMGMFLQWPEHRFWGSGLKPEALIAKVLSGLLRLQEESVCKGPCDSDNANHACVLRHEQRFKTCHMFRHPKIIPSAQSATQACFQPLQISATEHVFNDILRWARVYQWATQAAWSNDAKSPTLYLYNICFFTYLIYISLSLSLSISIPLLSTHFSFLLYISL